MLGAGIESLLRTLFVPSAAIGGAGSNSPYSTPEGARDSRIGSGPEDCGRAGFGLRQQHAGGQGRAVGQPGHV